jgi:nitrogen fixation NifU-like protein
VSLDSSLALRVSVTPTRRASEESTIGNAMDLRELYQDQIKEHSKKPRNFRAIEGAAEVHGHNPLCGDKLTLYVQLDGDKVKDVSFQGSGCAISTASASMMTEALKGKTRAQAEALFQAFHELVTGTPTRSASEVGDDKPSPPLGKLAVFSGVREFPVRVKCATLAWHTFNAALEGKHEPVSTE